MLDSVRYAIESSGDVSTNYEKVVEVASWMAFEELPVPEFALPFSVGRGDANEIIDFILVADSIDTAFTDFARHEVFQVDYGGKHCTDAEAEFACLGRALDRAIQSRELIARDSRWEIEIRAHCIYATALLCEEVNKLRPPNRQVLIPQIDARFWTHFHKTTWPHHLTQTIMY